HITRLTKRAVLRCQHGHMYVKMISKPDGYSRRWVLTQMFVGSPQSIESHHGFWIVPPTFTPTETTSWINVAIPKYRSYDALIKLVHRVIIQNWFSFGFLFRRFFLH